MDDSNFLHRQLFTILLFVSSCFRNLHPINAHSETFEEHCEHLPGTTVEIKSRNAISCYFFIPAVPGGIRNWFEVSQLCQRQPGYLGIKI